METGGAKRAAAAHLLRRTTFGPFPGTVDRLLDEHGSVEELREAILAAEPVELVTPDTIDEPFDPTDEATGNERLNTTWFERMASDEVGLHDKMTWFWHTHFPTSFSKAAGLYCWRQLRTLHEHALGNFGDLTKAICTDAAMLQYLDASGSVAADPNENLARELMELFTMGRGNYDEHDVRAAAIALAGWSVDDGRNGAVFEARNASTEPVTLLGRTAVFDPDLVVDEILAQDATAPFVVAKLAQFLVGDTVPPAQLQEWSALFRSGDYEIRPVVEAIVRSTAFDDSRMGRARTGIEWSCAVVRCTGSKLPPSTQTEQFLQIPYHPPNVAGWPNTWLSTSSLYARAALLYQISYPTEPIGDGEGDDLVDAIIEHCSLFEVSEPTRAALAKAADSPRGGQDHVLRAAFLAPEFQLS